MRRVTQPLAAAYLALLWVLFPRCGFATPPNEQDVDTYSSLCKIGSQSTLESGAGLKLNLREFIARRILAGEGKLSASKLQDEFPGIRDEKNRLLATSRIKTACIGT